MFSARKGRANEAVVALLADRLGIDPSSIAVVSGHGSPVQVVAVDGMDDEAIRQAFPREKPRKNGDMRNREEASYPFGKRTYSRLLVVLEMRLFSSSAAMGEVTGLSTP